MHLTLTATLASLATVLGAPDADGDASLLWGPYRPGLYFGVRPRVPESLLGGLMWYESSSLGGLGTLRHECRQEDGVAGFGWTAFDPRRGGTQVVRDTDNGVVVYTDFVKSEDGLSWELRVRGEQPSSHTSSFVWYAGLESADAAGAASGNFLRLNDESQLTPRGIAGDIVFDGYAAELGGAFTLSVSEGSGARPKHRHAHASTKPGDLSHYFGMHVPRGSVWRAQGIFVTLVQDQVNSFLEKYGEEETDVPPWAIFSLGDSTLGASNMHFVQKSFKGDFEFRVAFTPGGTAAAKRAAKVPFEDRLAEVLASQEQKFGTFALQAPYATPEFAAFANEMVSSVAGGLGYFYGDSVVKATDADGSTFEEHTEPRALFSGTPSRTFFPRGFYWDEGLNLLVLAEYDAPLVLEVLNSWFATMDTDGWIEREQILGDEARARVPEEFQVQDPSVANPPTLVLALERLLQDDLVGQLDTGATGLDALYTALQQHFRWFRRTQAGETTTLDREYASRDVFRWRGRTPTHILASGLDDYPRAPQPHDGELHVDLQAWLGALARSLGSVARRLGKDADAERYERVFAGIQENLAQFWSAEAGAYCDITVDEYEEDVHVCHIGYVTHLPFFTKLVPETADTQLRSLLAQLADPQQLWGVAGVRSLSMQDEHFGTGEDYWRGAVWNNMNFLALDALQHYARPASQTSADVKRELAKVYRDLRRTVVDNIHREWQVTGFVWESYDAVSGAARGAKAFTGWAALVANIMAMPTELDVPGVAGEVHKILEVHETPEVLHDESQDVLHEDL